MSDEVSYKVGNIYNMDQFYSDNDFWVHAVISTKNGKQILIGATSGHLDAENIYVIEEGGEENNEKVKILWSMLLSSYWCPGDEPDVVDILELTLERRTMRVMDLIIKDLFTHHFPHEIFTKKTRNPGKRRER